MELQATFDHLAELAKLCVFFLVGAQEAVSKQKTWRFVPSAMQQPSFPFVQCHTW